ncbi:MAG TPA: efflux RND transporter periplasmic adaptor subunit [Bacteroidetes bacterium]|nr:efflux RND transporter periplasmic adaptor subunit [Bacteroidota bacterium]
MKHLSYKHKIQTILSIFSITFIVSCSGGGESGGPQGMGGFPGGPGMTRATTVEVSEISRTTISDQIRAYGSVRAQDNVRVTPQVGERILRIYADLGDTVRAGQTLAKLNDTNFRQQFERDQAQMEQSRSALQRDSLNFNRQTELFNLNLVSQAELDNARTTFFASRAAFQSANAAMTQSRQNLSYTEVKSPVAGVVTSRSASPGDVVGTGQAIYEVSNLVGYEIRLYLPLGDWRNTKVGQPVNMRPSGASEFTAQGVVSRISPELDPVTGLGEVVISLTERGEGVFPGMLMESRINVTTKDNVVVIPRSAMVENVQTVIEPESNVIRLSRTYSAFVSQGDSIAVRRILDLGIQQGDRIEVLSGLEAGEKLIITGQTSLEDKSRVRVSSAPRFDREGNPQGAVQSTQGTQPIRGEGQATQRSN